MKQIPLVALLGLVALLLPACRSGPQAAPGASAVAERYTLVDEEGGRVGWGAMVSDAASADVVLIGEEHDNAAAQALAAELWEEILDRTGSAALSLEFLSRDQQVQVDDYLAGIIGPENEYGKQERYPAGHVRMIDAAREEGRPVIAANAPRRYVRAVARRGADALGGLPEDRLMLVVVPDEPPGGRYKERFVALMSGPSSHGHAHADQGDEARQRMVERMFLSQAIWDATMADSIARGLEAGHRPVVHVVGRFHVDHEGGTVQMLRKLRPGARLVVISFGESEGDDEETSPRADYVLTLPPAAE